MIGIITKMAQNVPTQQAPTSTIPSAPKTVAQTGQAPLTTPIIQCTSLLTTLFETTNFVPVVANTDKAAPPPQTSLEFP